MEIFTVILSSLLGLGSPVGVVVDQVAEDAIRGQLFKVEQLDVRVDNAPNFQLLQGRVEKLRIAGRGIYPTSDLRIALLDVETEPIDLDLGQLQQGHIVLDEPIQSAIHLVLSTEDINNFLQSDTAKAFLATLEFSLPGSNSARAATRYQLANPQVEFLANNRARIQVDLQDAVFQESLPITIETGITVVNGHQLNLVDPQILVDGQPAPTQLVNSLTEGLNEQLSLRILEESGITARVIDYSFQPSEGIDIAAFVRIEPSSPLLRR